MIRHGDPWGGRAGGPADLEVVGGDADLAAALAAFPGGRIAFRPCASSDVARTIGANPGERAGLEVVLDGLRITGEVTAKAVNAVVLGATPDRLRWTTPAVPLAVDVDGRRRFSGPATTVVVAGGQYLRGADVVPRGHPGDGRIEVQAYALARGERAAMRGRLAQGAHVPHPRIHESSGRRVEVRAGRGLRLEIDGVGRGRATAVTVEVLPGALTLLV